MGVAPVQASGMASTRVTKTVQVDLFSVPLSMDWNSSVLMTAIGERLCANDFLLLARRLKTTTG
jgi:hypothetical protein